MTSETARRDAAKRSSSRMPVLALLGIMLVCVMLLNFRIGGMSAHDEAPPPPPPPPKSSEKKRKGSQDSGSGKKKKKGKKGKK